MNQGEKNEILIKIYLCYLRDKTIKTKLFGKINKVGFQDEYGTTNWSEVNFGELEYDEENIKKLADILEISKNKPSYKADIKINNIFYSLKFTGSGKPTIVNHTSRLGWLNIANLKNLNISDLDNIISQYWKLRAKGEISEDCPNFHDKSPFNNKKEIIKPYLDFFLFEGSGQGVSDYPAEKILNFKFFNKPDVWKIYGREYLDENWDKLYFCLRYKKGIMPINQKAYDSNKNKKAISPWIKLFKGSKGKPKFRGALHVRVGK